MTTEVVISNVGGQHDLLLTILNDAGEVDGHHHLEAGQAKRIFVWVGAHIVLSENTPPFVKHRAEDNG